MGKFDKEIEESKLEIIEAKRKEWIANWLFKNPRARVAPIPPDEDVTPKAWFTAQWDTGYVVCDYEELKNMPKRKREKILALGGI